MKGPSRYSPVSDTDARPSDAPPWCSTRWSRPARSRRPSATRPSRSRCRYRRPSPASAPSISSTGSTAQVRALIGQTAPRTWWWRPRSTCRSRPTAEAAVRPGRRRRTPTRACSRRALVALDGEGRIRAYVGGVDYADSQFDRATQAQRQAGSSFKPFVYLTAMEAGHTPSEPVVDEPMTIGDWQPQQLHGQVPRPDHPGDGARPVDQHRRRAPRQRGRHQQRRRHRPPAGHRLADPDRSLDGAGRGGGDSAGNGRGL